MQERSLNSVAPLSVLPTSTLGLSRSVGTERTLLVTAICGAALAGALYALSPLASVLGCAFAGLLWWACADIGLRERRWVRGLVGGAVVLRCIAVLTFAARSDLGQESFWTLFGDSQYALQRSLWLRNTLLGIPVSPLDFAYAFEGYGRSGYYYPLAWLQVLLGPAPYALHLMSAAWYLAGTIAMFRLVRASFGVASAFIGLACVLYLPTLLLWSIVPLKESLYLSMSSIAAVSAIRAVRARPWTRALGAAAMTAAAIGAAGTLRSGGLQITLGGLAVGLALFVIFWRWWLVMAAIVVVPAATAIVLTRPVVQDAVLRSIRYGASVHIGHVMTAGASYKLLEDPRFYEHRRDPNTLGRADTVRYAAASVREFVLIPKPWAPRTKVDVAMIPQQLVWYTLVLFSLPGLVAGLRRDALLTCLLLGNVLVGVAVIAPTGGNVGTLIRHRDMIVPCLIWLGVLGGIVTMGWCASQGVTKGDGSDSEFM